MSVNTPASWSVHALMARLGMPSGPAALRRLTRLNVLLTSAAVKESLHVFVAGRVSGTVLSAWEQDILVRDWAGFLFVIRD